MATVEQCEAAMHRLAARLAEYRKGGSDDGSTPDRTISCRVRDLDVVFTGRLAAGQLTAIRRGTGRTAFDSAQIRFDLTGADLLELVDGTLDVGTAWVSGRLRVGAGFRDLIRLRSFL